MGIGITFISRQPSTAISRRLLTRFAAEQGGVSQCPFCDSDDTVAVRRNGVDGAITVCRCNKCHNEWPETIGEDPDEKD